MSIDLISLNNSSNLRNQKSARQNNIVNSDSFSSVLNSVSLAKTTDLDQIFEKASKKYNIPVNFLKAVAKAESGFNPKAVSSCGAQGVMQLMPGTAKSLGVTDSFDAEQNIMGGAKMLSGLLHKYNGNVSLALAAYNAGPGNVAKYGGIPPFKETQNYVKRVLSYCDDTLTAGKVTNTTSESTEKVGNLNALGLLQSLESSAFSNDMSNKLFADLILMSLYRYQLNFSESSDLEMAEVPFDDNI